MADLKTIVHVVDDDDLVRDVVVATLIDYGMEATASTDGISALKALETHPADIVLSDVRMPDIDGLEFVKMMKAKHPKIPVLLMSGFEDVLLSVKIAEVGAAGLVSKPCPGEELVDQIREILETYRGIETNDSDFARVSIADFVAGKMLPFHIYVRVAKNRYIRIANKGIDLDLARLRAYQERGVQFLHLRKHDFKSYFKTSVGLISRVEKDKRISPEKRNRFLKHTGELILEHCQIIGLDEEVVSGAREFLEHSLDVVSEDEGFVDLLELLNRHTDYVYAHCLAVSMVSNLIARRLKWESDATTFKIGLAGLFHDIGKKEIDRSILAKPRHLLTGEERAEVETHPYRGFKILLTIGKLPEEILQAVLQHHEEPTGLGYPSKIRGVGIAPMAQIVSLANIFCNYTVRNPSHPNGMSANEAIAQIMQFDQKRVTREHLLALKSVCVA